MLANQQATKQCQTSSIGKALQRLYMKGHVSLYRLTSGSLGSKSFLILTTIGRKSGQERDTPLFHFRDGDHYIVIASNAGAVKHPIWWLNLQANPRAKIQLGKQIIPVTAQQAVGDERKRLWSIIEEKYKNFVEFQKRTEREIPVIILTPDRRVA
jgi:F420H(2)-dependent quinone reductase